ncbi:peptide/nickel transport system permease protein [Kitasatospora sp. MMS16-BH015]|uniref:ABC transporter permease n=1 Tax=Kitasatospora sp. MMS16-BH015 TaxID=2018025 RepID=UPI000CA269FA|nr:ABC transporter permease [Kitasatospora sp. MMS16-BH015]AUG75385.1 peptide/nickel transport system permease protein [Kitasatospora sp. MMS16-BH015]
MIRFLLRRTADTALVLLAMSAVVYVIFYAAPHDPAVLVCGKGCDGTRLAVVRHKLGTDRPLWEQYGQFLRALVAGRSFDTGTGTVRCAAPCLGYSFQSDQPVLELITQRVPVDFSLTLGAMVVWLVLGVGTGLLSALRRGRFSERALTTLTLAGQSTPVFLVGLMAIMLFCSTLQWLPFPSYTAFTADPAQWAANLVLPWVSLALVLSAAYARMTRTSLLETMAEDHIRTNRAYGLTERRIVLGHALRGALVPVVTMLAIDVGGLLGGAMLTESVFGFDGLGRLLVTAVGQTDLPVVVGVTLFAGFFTVAANAAADVLYALADPRVSLA